MHRTLLDWTNAAASDLFTARSVRLHELVNLMNGADPFSLHTSALMSGGRET